MALAKTTETTTEKYDIMNTLSESLSDVYKYSINEVFRREFRLALRLDDAETSQYTLQKCIADRLKLTLVQIREINENGKSQQKPLGEVDDFEALANIEFQEE